jgi:hypothetical protein
MANKIRLEAKIELHKETAARREKAESVIDLPQGKDKQPDLLYFSAIFVSSGENLNHAYFLPSELVQAEGSIVNKALDVEHKEEEIIGHIYERAFISKDGQKLDLHELSSRETASLDKEDMHVVIAGIIYKNRFPNIADEVEQGRWKVSMEAYYQDFDVKVGDLMVSRKEAELLGLAYLDDVMGKVAKVVKQGKEIAEGAITRVLRHITFSGCGIVKKPANPPSVILETAKDKSGKEIIVLDLDKAAAKDAEELQNDVSNKVTSDKVETPVIPTDEVAELEKRDTTGICVSYKKRVLDDTFEGPDAKVIHEDWCTKYNSACTSFSRDTTDPECLYVKATMKQATAAIKERMRITKSEDSRLSLLGNLNKVMSAAKDLLSF